MPERRVFLEAAQFGAIAGVGDAAPLVDRRDEVHRRGGMRAQLIEAMQAEIVRAPFHAGRAERHAERRSQRRDVLEVDLLLKVLGAGGDQDALPAEDGRDQVGERLARAGARFREQHAAVLERVGDRARHRPLAGAGLELIDRPRERPIVCERRVDRALQARRSGYSGNFRHRVSTSALILARTLPSSGDASTREMNSAI